MRVKMELPISQNGEKFEVEIEIEVEVEVEVTKKAKVTSLSDLVRKYPERQA